VSLQAQLNQNITKVKDFQVEVVYPNIICETSFETRKKAIVEYLDYQIPVTQITNFKIS